MSVPSDMDAYWNAYFILKLLLQRREQLHLSAWPNLLLLPILYVSPPWERRRPRLKPARSAVGGVLALALLWRESVLPPLAQVARFLSDPTVNPSPRYVVEFLLNSVNPWYAAAAAIVVAACLYARTREIRLAPFVGALVAVVSAVSLATKPGQAQRSLDSFYRTEASRVVAFSAPPAGAADVDVVLVHVCSLSWDDLRASGLDARPFFDRFDVVFRGFNSATSYSNPAAVRLLNANCGQVPNAALFRPPRAACLLLDSLRKLGYKTYAAENHDGSYADFADTIARFGGADRPLATAGLASVRLNFNDSEIYGDYDVLSRWWRLRQQDAAPRAAVYYNTVSLHQGTHAPGMPGDYRKDRFIHYKQYGALFFDDLSRFFDLLERSGRNVAVIVVAEHGAALEGTRLQAPDLRDIPLPRITRVPAAVKFLGPWRRGRKPAALALDKPTSYLAVAALLASVLRRPAAADMPALKTLAEGLPETEPVSDGEGWSVLRQDGRWLYQSEGGAWWEVPTDAAGSL